MEVIMGACGTAISSNDEYKDIYSEIIEEFNKGTPIETVLQRINTQYSREFYDDENALNNLTFATAYAAWECGSETIEYFEAAKKIVDSGSDIECWRELGASESDLKKRKKALDAFIDKLSRNKEKHKKPKPMKFKPALYRKGQILSIQLNDGHYTGAVVLEELKASEEYGTNFIVKAFMNVDSKPSIDEILRAPVYDYAWYLGFNYKKFIGNIEIIGNLDIDYTYNDSGIGTTHSSWSFFVAENNSKYYKYNENRNIESVKAFLKFTPMTIAEAQKQSVLNRTKSV